MAKRKSKNKSRLTLILILICVLCLGLEKMGLIDINTSKYTNDNLGGETYIHFIDVGQGSSTLIQNGEHGILIDSGLSEYGDTVADFINSCGVSTLDCVIATHPHSDHIGSLVEVMEKFSVEKVIMPALSDINTPTTRTYEELLDYIIDNDIDAAAIELDTAKSITFKNESTGGKITLTLLGPCKQIKDLNNMSVVCKAEALGGDVMLLGDAEKTELSSIISNGITKKVDLKSDILLMGHHGSETSVYEPFLNKVDADIAVISAGKDNSYGHPHEEALNYCEENGMDVYRTDIHGTVSFMFTENGMVEVE